jgi:hypothetical protein
MFLQLVATCVKPRVAIDSPPGIIRKPRIVARFLPSWRCPRRTSASQFRRPVRSVVIVMARDGPAKWKLRHLQEPTTDEVPVRNTTVCRTSPACHIWPSCGVQYRAVASGYAPAERRITWRLNDPPQCPGERPHVEQSAQKAPRLRRPAGCLCDVAVIFGRLALRRLSKPLNLLVTCGRVGIVG